MTISVTPPLTVTHFINNNDTKSSTPNSSSSRIYELSHQLLEINTFNSRSFKHVSHQICLSGPRYLPNSNNTIFLIHRDFCSNCGPKSHYSLDPHFFLPMYPSVSRCKFETPALSFRIFLLCNKISCNIIFFLQDRGSTRVLKCINKPIFIEKGSLNNYWPILVTFSESKGVATVPLFICLSNQISVKMPNSNLKFSSSRAICGLMDYTLRNQGCYNQSS